MIRGRSVVWAAFLALIGLTAGLSAQDQHQNQFDGKTTQFIRGDANVKLDVKAHDLSGARSRSLPTSEHLKLTVAAGKNESNFAYFYYPTPRAPLTDDLTAELWVHSNKAGVQLMARVVFPKIRNPKQIDEPLTRIVAIDTYRAPAGGWQKLVLKRPGELLEAQKQALRLELKGDPDISGAYIDRLLLNLYAGAGDIEVYLDNLEIGPVLADKETLPVPPKGVPPKEKLPARADRGVPVDFERGRLTVGGVQAFPRFVRYVGTPLQVLKDAGFNSIYVPADTPMSVLEDAIGNHKLWIIPHLPPISETNSEDPASPLRVKDVEALNRAIRKFQSNDGVLFWDLGPVRFEDYRRASRTVEALRQADPRRPVGADVWDAFGRFAIPVQLTGIHRDPLQTSLELEKYNQWFAQRKILSTGSRFPWTWVQSHMPEWQMRLMYGRTSADGLTEPIGPQPEQIRLLTYIALANGCKALGFSADRLLAHPTYGRERLLQMAILNQEIQMLEPLLQDMATEDPRWINTSNPNIRVAVLRTNRRGLLALPIWFGNGAQCVPPQGAAQGLTFTIPLVPDGAEPWEITPVRVQSLQSQVRQTPDGLQVTLPEFDLTAAIAFTSDNAPDGLLAAWQKHTRRVGPAAAAWACELADEQFRKVVQTHARLESLAPAVENAAVLLHESERLLVDAKKARFANNDEAAYLDAIRALRPLRILMRAHWERAVQSLDYAAATPYSVSFYSLPRHYELSRALHASKYGPNQLPDGDFETLQPADRAGLPATALRNWALQEVALDEVVMTARYVPSAEAKDPDPPPLGKRPYYAPTASRELFEDALPPRPELGGTVLKLTVSPKPVVLTRDNEKVPPEPQALERVFLCVNSPPVKLPPGSWCRISGWIKVPTATRRVEEGGTVRTVELGSAIRASADGAMFFDTTAGEAYAVRLTTKTTWKRIGGDLPVWRQFHMYRQVPASGELRVRMALTGFGTVYFDNIKVEPVVGSAPPAADGAVTAEVIRTER